MVICSLQSFCSSRMSLFLIHFAILSTINNRVGLPIFKVHCSIIKSLCFALSLQIVWGKNIIISPIHANDACYFVSFVFYSRGVYACDGDNKQSNVEILRKKRTELKGKLYGNNLTLWNVYDSKHNLLSS